MKDLFEKVSEKELTPLEGLEVLTDYGKRYYFKKSGWCRWDNSKQEYVISNVTVGYWYKPLPLPETEITEKDFENILNALHDPELPLNEKDGAEECYQLAQRMVLQSVERKEEEVDRLKERVEDLEEICDKNNGIAIELTEAQEDNQHYIQKIDDLEKELSTLKQSTPLPDRSEENDEIPLQIFLGKFSVDQQQKLSDSLVERVVESMKEYAQSRPTTSMSIDEAKDRVAKGLSDYERLSEISKDQAAKMLGYDDFKDIFEVEDFDSEQKDTITKIVNNALHVFSLNR